MANTFQCPQCGSASSTKVNETEYHCIYCQSNFSVKPNISDSMNEFLKKKIETQKIIDSITHTSTSYRTSKTPVIVGVSIFMVFFIAIALVIFSVSSKSSGIVSKIMAGWQAPSISKFNPFAGSKNEVCWLLMNSSRTKLDSSKFTLRIIDPKANTVLNEFNFLPVMTWKEGFNADARIGDFIQYGDTIWIPTEEDGLVARDIYTGTVIVSSAQLSQKFPELAKGISKAEKEWGKKVFKLSTADGFEYYFSPVTNSIYKKSELEHQLKSNGSPRTFFILADGKRPLLYKSIEKRNPLYRLSDVSSYDLEHYNNKGNNFRKSSAVISIKELNPDKPYFNGIIAYSDEKKVIILYQPENSKKSEMIVSCLDADGHELWNIKGKDTEDFRTVFADSNRAIDFSSSSSTLILYFRRANCIAMGIDVNTGAIKWKYSNAL